MARDLRQVGCQKNDYPDRCYLYDSDAVEHSKLVKDAQPICRFYKNDLVPFRWEFAKVNGITTSRKQFIGTIETLDHVEQARPDMYVVDQTGALFIIVPPIVSDDANKTKVIGTRPSIKTVMTLRGLVD